MDAIASMSTPRDRARRAAAIGLLLCASIAARAAPVDDSIAVQLQSLDPERISEREVHDVLARGPAPQVILIQGSSPLITMDPFAEFLIAMGYPQERLRNPADGSFSWSSFGSSEKLAGTLAWYYERDGMMPMLIGHSQGGMMVIQTLYELARHFSDRIPGWDPVAGNALPRSQVVDPLTGEERPVVGLQVQYATALATGKLMRIVLGQWSMLPLLRRIPD